MESCDILIDLDEISLGRSAMRDDGSHSSSEEIRVDPAPTTEMVAPSYDNDSIDDVNSENALLLLTGNNHDEDSEHSSIDSTGQGMPPPANDL